MQTDNGHAKIAATVLVQLQEINDLLERKIYTVRILCTHMNLTHPGSNRARDQPCLSHRFLHYPFQDKTYLIQRYFSDIIISQPTQLQQDKGMDE